MTHNEIEGLYLGELDRGIESLALSRHLHQGASTTIMHPEATSSPAPARTPAIDAFAMQRSIGIGLLAVMPLHAVPSVCYL